MGWLGSGSFARFLSGFIDIRTVKNSPSTKGYVQADSLNINGLIAAGRYTSTSSSPMFYIVRSRGTIDAPSAVMNNDPLMRMDIRGYGATTFPVGRKADISILAAENWTDTLQGTKFSVSTCLIGGAVLAARFGVSGYGDFYCTSTLSIGIYTAAQLAALNPLSLVSGSRATCSDALAPAFGAAVVGGGAVVVPVYWNGATWMVG